MSDNRSSTANTLVLTATITPPQGVTNLTRVDPGIRLDDYCRAFEFYCRTLAEGTITQLIFAENSGSDISRLRDLAEKYGVSRKTEFICYPGLDYPPEYGRGYGEFKLIDKVMKSSSLIQDLRAHENIWKITGRYVLRNISTIIATRPPKADFYCHCRNIPIPWIDLFVLSWNKKAYDELLDDIYLHLQESRIHGPCEQGFRKLIDESNFKSKIVKRFRTIPQLEGYRGWDGHRYEKMGLKLKMRKLANVFAPWLWI
jgi:hypothetical protein